jgi:hypothetical protein
MLTSFTFSSLQRRKRSSLPWTGGYLVGVFYYPTVARASGKQGKGKNGVGQKKSGPNGERIGRALGIEFEALDNRYSAYQRRE